MSTPITLTGAYTCTHHNDKQRAECPVCLVAKLRAAVERLRSDRDCEKRLRKDADEFRENAIERATKAEADAERYRLVTLRQDAQLATAKERLRSEAMDDYAAIKDLQRELATERARLDWVFRNCKVIADGYAIHDREDLGVAMKEDAK